MKVFIHTGKGHYVGSTVIAIAKSKKTAEKLIREALDEDGLTTEELDVSEVNLEDSEPQVIHFDNGDY